MKDPEIFDLKEAAAYLGVPPLQMRTLAKAGKVIHTRVDRTHWRFAGRDLDAFLERRTYRARTAFES